ncbi:MAG: outer membrane beta-barrel domain-containing protein [Pseudomonadota bacterium]
MKIALRNLTLWVALSGLATTAFAGVGGYKKATEGDDVIKNKAYPKKGRVELNGPNVGLILNQSYVDTYLINGGINYFWSESWGLGLEAYYAMNKDKKERYCIENFYNDPDYDISSECGGPGNLAGHRGNYGPAYVNIREYNFLLAANGIWNPIYGKEIFFMSGVVNFDVFMTLGGGLAMSTFYPMQTTLGNGKPSRGQFPGKDTSGDTPGTDPKTDGDLYYGKNGRPTAQKQTNVFLDGGIGQKVHFGDKFNLKAELRSHLVLGTPGGFDMFFSLWGGFGMRF